VDAAVEADAEPASVADVRRAKESVGVGFDEHLLDAALGGAPDCEAPVAVVAVEHHQEGPLVPDEERRVTVAQAFVRLGQGEAQLPEPRENPLPLGRPHHCFIMT
jgi:hypothetical protein